MEEEAPLNQLTTVEQSLEQQGEELWQQYALLASNDYPNATDQNTSDFWQQYFQLIHQAQQYRLVKNTDKALVLANETFLSNEQQFKSVPIPLGQYVYKAKGIHPKMQRYLGVTGIWIANFLGMGAGVIPPSLISANLFVELLLGVYIVVKIMGVLTDKSITSVVVEPTYIRNKASQFILAFKDISIIKETDKGLLIKSSYLAGKKEASLLIPKNVEEYHNIAHFIKQVAAVNEQHPNIYPNLPAIKAHHWATPIVEINPEHRFIVPRKGRYGIGAVPLDWAGVMLGIVGGSVFGLLFSGIPIFILTGVVGWVYILEVFKSKKRFNLKQIQVTQEHLQYTFSYNHKPRTIHIPLKDIYGLRVGRRGIKILNAKGKAYWQTLEYPHKKYVPILPKKMPELPRLQVFLEDVIAHNKGLG